MFLPDIPKTLSEIRRVLKPGGYLAAAVWSDPDKNPFLQLPMQVLGKMMELPKPDPDLPGVFRLAAPGDLVNLANSAGLEPISDEEVLADSAFDSAEF